MKIGFNEGCNRFCENHSVLEDLALCEKYGFDYMVGYKKGRYYSANLIRQTCAKRHYHSKVTSHHPDIVRIIVSKRYSYILYCNRA